MGRRGGSSSGSRGGWVGARGGDDGKGAFARSLGMAQWAWMRPNDDAPAETAASHELANVVRTRHARLEPTQLVHPDRHRARRERRARPESEGSKVNNTFLSFNTVRFCHPIHGYFARCSRSFFSRLRSFRRRRLSSASSSASIPASMSPSGCIAIAADNPPPVMPPKASPTARPRP